MLNEVLLIHDIWDAAQKYNRAKTVQMYKHKLNRFALQRSSQLYNIKRLDGEPFENLRTLSEDVCKVFDIRLDQFKSSKRIVDVCYPRHVYHKVAVDNYISSFANIAKYSGRMDHTTIIASYKRANNLIETNDRLFCNYWHRYIIHGNPTFTNIYTPDNEIVKVV